MPTIRQFDQNVMTGLLAVLRDWQFYGRRLIDLLGPERTGPRLKTVPRNAFVTGTISARSGFKKGTGIVSIVCDDGTGTGTDATIQTNVTVWNPFKTAIAPPTDGTKRYVTLEIVDGQWQVRGADCP